MGMKVMLYHDDGSIQVCYLLGDNAVEVKKIIKPRDEEDVIFEFSGCIDGVAIYVENRR